MTIEMMTACAVGYVLSGAACLWAGVRYGGLRSRISAGIIFWLWPVTVLIWIMVFPACFISDDDKEPKP